MQFASVLIFFVDLIETNFSRMHIILIYINNNKKKQQLKYYLSSLIQNIYMPQVKQNSLTG